jgi:predicted DNA-binding transcriptional regulator AlpA
VNATNGQTNPAPDTPSWAAELLGLLRDILGALQAREPDEPTGQKLLLTMKDLSALSGFSLPTLERMLARERGLIREGKPARGELPTPLCFGRNVRFRRADVERWLQERGEQQPETPQSRRRRRP